MVAIVSRSSCLGCSNSFEPRDGKLYCSEACRRKSERKRARLRRQEPPRPPRPRLPLGVCRDCGTTDDMYWWQAKPGYSKSGTSRSVPVTSAATRCRACYNEYCRRRYHAKRHGQIVGRMHGPRQPTGKPQRSLVCPVCSQAFTTSQPNAICCSRRCNYAAKNAKRVGADPLVCPCGTPSYNVGGLCRPCTIATTNEASAWPALTPIRFGRCTPCGSTFTVHPNHQHGDDNCSTECASRRRQSLVAFGTCTNCAKTFCRRHWQVGSFCSRRCRSATENRRRDAWKRAGRVGRVRGFTLRQVAERDGWRCHLCGKRVLDRPFRNRDGDPTEDHLVPLSRGGSDSFENVRLAHFRCNTDRGVGGAVQLLLIA